MSKKKSLTLIVFVICGLVIAVVGVGSGQLVNAQSTHPPPDPNIESYVDRTEDGYYIKASTDNVTSEDINDPYVLQWALDNCPVEGTVEIGPIILNFGDDNQNGPRKFVVITKSLTVLGATELVYDKNGRPTGALKRGTTPTKIFGGGKINPGGAVFHTPEPENPGTNFEVTIKKLWFLNWAGDALRFDHDGPETVRGCKFTEPVFDQAYAFRIEGFPHYHAINSFGLFSTSSHLATFHENYIDMAPKDGLYNYDPAGNRFDDVFCISVVGEGVPIQGDIAYNTVKNATQFQILTQLNPGGGTRIYENSVETGEKYLFYGFSSGITVGFFTDNVEVYDNDVTSREGFLGISFWGSENSTAYGNHIIDDGGAGLYTIAAPVGAPQKNNITNNLVTGSGPIGISVQGQENAISDNDLSGFKATTAQVSVAADAQNNTFNNNAFGNIVGSEATAGLACAGVNNSFNYNYWTANYPNWRSGRGLWLMAEGAAGNMVTTTNSNIPGGVKPDKHWMDRNAKPTNILEVNGTQVKP